MLMDFYCKMYLQAKEAKDSAYLALSDNAFNKISSDFLIEIDKWYWKIAREFEEILEAPEIGRFHKDGWLVIDYPIFEEGMFVSNLILIAREYFICNLNGNYQVYKAKSGNLRADIQYALSGYGCNLIGEEESEYD